MAAKRDNLHQHAACSVLFVGAVQYRYEGNTASERGVVSFLVEGYRACSREVAGVLEYGWRSDDVVMRWY